MKRINKNKEEQILHLPNHCPHCTLGMRPDKNNSQHCIGGAQLFPLLCNAMSSIHGCVAEGKGRAWNRPPVLGVRWCTLITDTLVQFMHTVEALIRTLKANHKAWNGGRSGTKADHREADGTEFMLIELQLSIDSINTVSIQPAPHLSSLSPIAAGLCLLTGGMSFGRSRMCRGQRAGSAHRHTI